MINEKEVYHKMWRPIFFSILVIFGYCLEYVAVEWNHPIFKAFFYQRMFTAISSFCLCSRSLTLLAQYFK